jgi:tyrosyl-tRNA synthetase
MLLQAYDFYELNNRYNIQVQIGGSDQWGNIINGVDLIRRTKKSHTFALTTPLITTSDGKKMGKSVSGAVWLDRSLLSEYDYWQFWRNVSDADLPRFLRLYTDLPMDRIREMDSWKDCDLNKAKVVLADEATKLLHGECCLSNIHSTTKSLFSSGASSSAGSDLTCLPKYVIDPETRKLVNGDQGANASALTILDLLVKSSLAPTRNEGRRMVAGGCVRINDVKVDDEYRGITSKDFNFCSDSSMKLSVSKKKHMLVYLS